MTRTPSLILFLGVIACQRSVPSARTTTNTPAAGERPAESLRVAPDTKSPAASPVIPSTNAPPLDSATVHRELTPSMRQVLGDSIPGFVAWTMEHYAPEVQQWVRQRRQNAPWAVFGDFNRDSIPDLVMDGTDGRRSLRVALVSTRHTYRLLILNAFPLSDQLLHNSIEFLAYEAPGTVDTLACNEQEDQCHAVPFHFAADAFQVVFFEKASSLWYWTGDGFTESSTSD